MSSTDRASDVFAFTCTYRNRLGLSETVRKMRATAGMWFDWGVWAGNPSPAAFAELRALVDKPDGTGIQLLNTWPENRGQHHATVAALAHAREHGYPWLLRIDDDISPKTKKWLKQMVERSLAIQRAAKAPECRIVSAPRVLGLRNPLQPIGILQLEGLNFPADAMGILGGALRLHPVPFLKDYQPPLLAPRGRQDPQTIAIYTIEDHDGLLVRFPDIRVIHDTKVLEGAESKEDALHRQMAYIWPYLSEDTAA